MIDSRRAEVSIVIGLVSTEDRDRILETLDSLENRQGSRYCEVILVDRRRDAISSLIKNSYPGVRLVPCAPNTTLPEMRTIGFEHSCAPIVGVTEDHCVPDDHWLDAVITAFSDPGVCAVGGPVVNGVVDSAYDWATYLCEYSFFCPPLAEGPSEVLPGMNVAYRRDSLRGISRSQMTKGFWETTVHPQLLKQGGIFVLSDQIKMFHCKKFSKALFTRQRYIYSRYFAGIRFPKYAVLKRTLAVCSSVTLPLILFWRMRRIARSKRLDREFQAALPSLVWLLVVWSIGEMVGYAVGPGSALIEIE